MNIKVDLKENGYDVVVGRKLLCNVGEYLNLQRKVLVVTDSGVPKEYSDQVMTKCKEPVRVIIEQGEKSKSFENYQKLLLTMLENEFTRTDAVVAVGGGVVGDLSGFVASTYMRGIDFYNIPTTVLSQIDSSVGGKTAIDFGNYKNTVGAFYQPKKVLADVDTLKTLPQRQISNGLAESVKIALTFDEELFSVFESGKVEENIEKIIQRSIELKRDVVEKDEKEAGLRKVLNFGHTIGHAVESAIDLDTLYHGECVSIGMLSMCSDGVRKRLEKVLLSLSLPTGIQFDTEKVTDSVMHDKKFDGDELTVIKVEKVGTFKMEKIAKSDIVQMIEKAGGKA